MIISGTIYTNKEAPEVLRVLKETLNDDEKIIYIIWNSKNKVAKFGNSTETLSRIAHLGFTDKNNYGHFKYEENLIALFRIKRKKETVSKIEHEIRKKITRKTAKKELFVNYFPKATEELLDDSLIGSKVGGNTEWHYVPDKQSFENLVKEFSNNKKIKSALAKKIGK